MLLLGHLRRRPSATYKWQCFAIDSRRSGSCRSQIFPLLKGNTKRVAKLFLAHAEHLSLHLHAIVYVHVNRDFVVIMIQAGHDAITDFARFRARERAV
jgi:hypothetical protein